MKKVLSTLVLTSSLAILLVPALLVPTTVSAATCPNCQTPLVSCACGTSVLGPDSGLYCYNKNWYDNLPDCQAAMSGGGGGGAGVGGVQNAPTLITSVGGLITLITNIGNVIFSILLGVAAIMLILAGFFWVTAGGNPEGVKKASDMLRNALIGVAVALAAKGLVLVIRSIMGG